MRSEIMSASPYKPFRQVQGLAKSFSAGAAPVFEQVSFGIERGEFTCVIGHSGCGKTTILNVLAGLHHATGGHVFMDEREVSGPCLERGVVFQGHALMPWLSVLRNVTFAVKSRWPQWPAVKIEAHALRYIEMVGL